MEIAQKIDAIRFDDVFCHAPVGISVADECGQFLQVNTFFCELFGYSEPELLARKISDVTHRDDIALGVKDFQRILRERPTAFLSIEKRYLRKNGEVFWGEVSLSALKDKAGRPRPYILGILKDISRQKAAEEKLLLSEHLFSSAFSHAGVGMALLDTEGRFIKVNRAFCDFLGYSQEQFKTIGFQNITYPEDLSSDVLQFNALLAGDITAYAMHKRYIHASGELRWGALSVSLARRSDGTIDHVISQIQDIHAQKEMEVAYKSQANLYEGLFTSAFAFIVLLSPDGLIEDINLNGESLLGGDKENLRGFSLAKRPCFQGFALQQERLLSMIQDAVLGRPVQAEIQAMTPTGVMTLDFSLRSIKNAVGKVQHLVAEAHEVSLHQEIVLSEPKL